MYVAIEKGILPNQQALQNIAEQTDAELVVVIELNKLKLEPVPRGREDMAQFTMNGKIKTFGKNLRIIINGHF